MTESFWFSCKYPSEGGVRIQFGETPHSGVAASSFCVGKQNPDSCMVLWHGLARSHDVFTFVPLPGPESRQGLVAHEKTCVCFSTRVPLLSPPGVLLGRNQGRVGQLGSQLQRNGGVAPSRTQHTGQGSGLCGGRPFPDAAPRRVKGPI